MGIVIRHYYLRLFNWEYWSNTVINMITDQHQSKSYITIELNVVMIRIDVEAICRKQIENWENIAAYRPKRYYLNFKPKACNGRWFSIQIAETRALVWLCNKGNCIERTHYYSQYIFCYLRTTHTHTHTHKYKPMEKNLCVCVCCVRLKWLRLFWMYWCAFYCQYGILLLFLLLFTCYR